MYKFTNSNIYIYSHSIKVILLKKIYLNMANLIIHKELFTLCLSM